MKANEPSNMTDTVDKTELRDRILASFERVLTAWSLDESAPEPLRDELRRFVTWLPELRSLGIASHTEGAGAEPVAWQWRYKYGDEKWGGWQNTRRYDAEELLRNNVLIAEETRPLYTSPTLPGDVVVVPREIVDGLREDFRTVRKWSGSALVANELPKRETREGLSELYRDLCTLGNSLDYYADQLAARIAAAPIPTPEGKVADAPQQWPMPEDGMLETILPGPLVPIASERE
jgi:hypothetical protein